MLKPRITLERTDPRTRFYHLEVWKGIGLLRRWGEVLNLTAYFFLVEQVLNQS